MENNENNLNNEKEINDKGQNNNRTTDLNKEDNKIENETKEKDKKIEIKQNQLNDMKYEILKEDYPEFDLSFKVIVIGNSGI